MIPVIQVSGRASLHLASGQSRKPSHKMSEQHDFMLPPVHSIELAIDMLWIS